MKVELLVLVDDELRGRSIHPSIHPLTVLIDELVF